MSATYRDQRGTKPRVQKGGSSRRLTKREQRELDRIAQTGLAPIVEFIYGTQVNL